MGEAAEDAAAHEYDQHGDRSDVLDQVSMVPAAERRMDVLPPDLEARVDQAVKRAQVLHEIVKRCLVDGTDYGTIPGTKKPTLYQSGAQQLGVIFGLTPRFEILDKTIERDPPFVSYTVRCQVISRDTSEIVGEGMAEGNSYETKHRYRYRYVRGERERYENPDILEVANTLLKMTSKRAFVAAVLNATGASRLFTQDLEDIAPSGGDDGQKDRPASGGQRSNASGSGSRQAGPGPSTEPQRKACYALANKVGADKDTMAAATKRLYDADKPDQLTKQQASDLIERLQRVKDGKEALDVALGFATPVNSDSEPENDAPGVAPDDEEDVPF